MHPDFEQVWVRPLRPRGPHRRSGAVHRGFGRAGPLVRRVRLRHRAGGRSAGSRPLQRHQRASANRTRPAERQMPKPRLPLRAKDDFLAALSHELRTPLTPVLLAASDLCDDPTLPASARETLRMMQRNIGLEARLIDDLLDLTRIAKGKLDPARAGLRGALARGACGGDRARRRAGQGHHARRTGFDCHADALRGRPGPHAAGVLEPAQERGEVHPRWRAGHRAFARRGRQVWSSR